MRKVVAFCGFEQSGKSYSAKRLMTTRKFKHLAFADALRDCAFHTIGMDFEGGMKKYEELKKTDLINGLTFRNILENLGSAVRKYDKDFWVKAVLKLISDCTDNVCISDLRYSNEYWIVKKYCEENEIDFKLVFCDYHSDGYRDDNPHESARFAKYLKELGYEDQQYVKEEDILQYDAGL